MKIKTIICVLLAFQLSVHAQEPKKKPSWTDSMPERDDAPDMKMQIEDDDDEDDFGLDRNSLGFDRDELSSTEDTSSAEGTTQKSTSPKMTNKIEIQKQLDNERKKNAAQQAKIKKLEAEKLEAEKLAQKNQVEQEKITAQYLVEKELKEQKQIQEKITSQKLAEQDKIQQEKKPTEVTQQKPKNIQFSNSAYKWKKTKSVAPIYPSKASRKKIEGWVDVEITVDSTGKVVDAKVLRSKRNARIFDKSALKAVKQWKYEPPSKFGINSKLSKTIRVVYKL